MEYDDLDHQTPFADRLATFCDGSAEAVEGDQMRGKCDGDPTYGTGEFKTKGGGRIEWSLI